jgi:hypothetical protein
MMLIDYPHGIGLCCSASPMGCLLTIALADTFLVRTPVRPLSRAHDTGLTDPLFQEALWLASPDLLSEALRSRAGELPARETARVERSLLKYALRMATRSTPFGLFASCSVGRFDPATTGALEAAGRIRRFARLDMGIGFRIAAALTAEPSVRATLRFFPNSTLYRVAGDVRYYEHARDEGGLRRYRLVSVEGTPHLFTLLEAARAGATLDQLAAGVADAEVSVEEAREYADSAVVNQILVGSLEPSLTDPAFLDTIIAALPESARASLQSLSETIQRGDVRAVNRPVEQLAPGANTNRIVQVDAFRPAALTLSLDLREQLRQGVMALMQWPERRATPLDAFHQAFRERFGDRRVPVLEAVDVDLGVPFGHAVAAEAPLLEGLDDLGGAMSVTSFEASPLTMRILPAIREALDAGMPELRLDDLLGDIEISGALPPTMVAHFSVANIDRVYRIVLKTAGGSSALAMVGRFAHLDPTIDAYARELAAREQSAYRDAIVAELLHVPEDRHANVLQHLPFRDLEIPCLGRASAALSHQLPLDDLLVAASADGAVRLWSRSRAVEVIPALSNAHRFDSDELVPVYRLLAALQARGSGRRFSMPIDWLLMQLPRLPRISYRGCVLLPAMWKYSGTQLDELPRKSWLLDASGENEILLDLDSAACVDLLDAELRARSNKRCVLVEDLFGDDLWINGPDGGYANEVIAAVLT